MLGSGTMARKTSSQKDDARAWALLIKHGSKGAYQRWQGRRMVRVDLLLEVDDAVRLSEIVNEVNRLCPRRLTRAEVGRHLLTRSIMQCTRQISRNRAAARRAAQKQG